MALSTFALAFTAAYYSVYGLSSMFAGSKIEVIIMASALELSKLVIVSYLHNNWNRIGRFLKTYLTLGVMVLMLITSAGIYGFLTSAYQYTANKFDRVNNEITLLETKRDRFSSDVERYNVERLNISTTISDLSEGLSHNVIQYKDVESGEIITTTSSATRKVLTNQLNDTKLSYDKNSDKIDALNDSITKYDIAIVEVNNNNDISAELGPLLYITELTGKPMNEIVNWFTLLIVLVFDPLAIAMVISLNKYINHIGDSNKMITNNKVISKSTDSMLKRKRKS